MIHCPIRYIAGTTDPDLGWGDHQPFSLHLREVALVEITRLPPNHVIAKEFALADGLERERISLGLRGTRKMKRWEDTVAYNESQVAMSISREGCVGGAIGNGRGSPVQT